MQVLVMFDLPVKTSEQKRTAGQFRRYLVKNGFIMLQESVYCKLAINHVAAQAIQGKVSMNCPIEGNVAMFSITDAQFSKIESLAGAGLNNVVHNKKRLIIL